MKPAARRRVERALQVLMEKNGDNCSICDKPFPHNSKTFGGATAAGTVALVGECCARKIEDIVISGIYFDHPYDVLNVVGDSSASPLKSAEALEKHIEGLQGHFADVDKTVAGALRDAGLSTKRMSVSVLSNAWKTEDAAWFNANPKRSHRLRAMFPGEDASLFDSSGKPIIPPGHEFQVVVRQLKPGTRIRMPFCRNVEVPIPDVEPAIHAIFDVISGDRDRQGVISVKEVAEIATKYAIKSDVTKPN